MCAASSVFICLRCAVAVSSWNSFVCLLQSVLGVSGVLGQSCVISFSGFGTCVQFSGDLLAMLFFNNYILFLSCPLLHGIVKNHMNLLRSENVEVTTILACCNLAFGR